MFVRNMMVAAMLVAAAKGGSKALSEDDFQLLAIAPHSMFSEDDVQLLATVPNSLYEDALLAMVPERVKAQADAAESISSVFSGSDAVSEPARSSMTTAAKVATAIDVQADAMLPAPPQPATAMDGRKLLDTAMLQMYGAESIAGLLRATKLTTASMEDLSAESNDTAQDGGDQAVEIKEAAANISMRQAISPSEKEAQPTFFQAESALFQAESELATMTQKLMRQIEHELQLPEAGPLIGKDKRALAVLTALVVPSFFGMDRCYLGQYVLGTLKGLTFGGCALWALCDWCYVMYSCLTAAPAMNSFMFRATFSVNSVHGAFFVALFGVLASCTACMRHPRRHHQKI